jgi:hypothetical protein
MHIKPLGTSRTQLKMTVAEITKNKTITALLILEGSDEVVV